MFFLIFFFSFLFWFDSTHTTFACFLRTIQHKTIQKQNKSNNHKNKTKTKKTPQQPAHVKACFLGSSLTLPISEGRLALGTWQGIWLCEHRDQAGSRKLMITLQGCLRAGDSNNLGSSTGIRSSGRSPAGANPGADSPLASTSSS